MWSTKFADGDRVEWIGPPPAGPDNPEPGERGTVISIDPLNVWIVRFDSAGTAGYDEEYLRKVEE